ncbi:MAG: hypothetical protein WCS51_05720 [Bacilli bacterium]|jgi:hypothetical protein
MKKLFKSKKSTLILYSIVNLVIALASLFFLLMNVYEVSMVLFIATLFNIGYLALILFYGNKNEDKSLAETKSVVVFAFIRSIIEIASLVICAILIYFIPSMISDVTYNKYRILFVILNLVPYFGAIFCFELNTKYGE